MALLGNDNKKTIEELESYYSNKTKRTGMAWAMAFLSLVITFAVLGGLFFGGRWVYRQITDGSANPVVQIESDTDDASGTQTEEPVVGEFGISLTENDDTEGLNSDSDPETSSTDDTGVVASSVSSEPNNELPDTGASAQIVLIPLVVFAAAYTFARTRIFKL